jgi:hypothetical protein
MLLNGHEVCESSGSNELAMICTTAWKDQYSAPIPGSVSVGPSINEQSQGTDFNQLQVYRDPERSELGRSIFRLEFPDSSAWRR